MELTGRLQAGTANKEPVNIGLSGKLAAVLLADGATVDDTDVVGSLGGDGLAEPLADSGVDILGLLGGSDLAGSNSPKKKKSVPCHDNGQHSVEAKEALPNGLVGNDNLGPLLLAQLLGGSVELAGDDFNGLVGITLLNYYQISRV